MNQEFYQQPHVFLLFKAGSSGNLISAMLDCLINNSTEELTMSTSGNAHNNNIVKRKREGVDYISLGSGIVETEVKFFSPEEKLAYYKDKIDSYSYDNRPYVTWTHDFDNIDLYKKLFPNSKTVIITTDSVYETLVGLILHINKNIFDVPANSPLGEFDQIFIDIIKKNMIKRSFKNLYKGKIYQEGLSDLDLHLLYSYNQGILNVASYPECELAHRSEPLTWAEEKMIHFFNNGLKSDADYKIKLIDILQAKEEGIDNITDVFGKILNRSLTHSELDYIKSTIKNYVSSQNADILNDPYTYLSEVKKKADKIVDTFN